jgi:hypothetical protein
MMKHIALKYHHFREHFSSGMIKVNMIGTKDQIADILAKALDKPSFTQICYRVTCDSSCHPFQFLSSAHNFEE